MKDVFYICVGIVLLAIIALQQFQPQPKSYASALEGDGYRLVQVGDMPIFIRIYDPDKNVTACYFDRVSAQQIICPREGTPVA